MPKNIITSKINNINYLFVHVHEYYLKYYNKKNYCFSSKNYGIVKHKLKSIQ